LNSHVTLLIIAEFQRRHTQPIRYGGITDFTLILDQDAAASASER